MAAAAKVAVQQSCLTMDIPVTQLPPGDPRLVEAIVSQLKSKGIFDQFRKECLADVDTKPAFQNLRQRVEGHVNKFLEKRTWKNDINKNQLRDGVRKHVNSLGILDSGIDAIITQVVNPKIKPLILPYVEDTVYAFLQIDKPKRERQGTNTSVPDDSVFLQVHAAPDIKPSLLPMETDVISSEEDDILVRESPESEHKSSPSSHGDFMEPENEDAQDGFETFPSVDNENNTDAVASHVEKLSLADNTEESKALPIVKPPLPLFDDQSLDSISSNSSGLTFSTLSGKGSPGSRKSLDLTEKDDNTKLQEPRSATSTPLVDEKPMDDEGSHSSVASEPLKEYPVLASGEKPVESHSPSLDVAVMSATPPQSSIGAERDDQTVVSGASLISQDDDSQGSRGSTSKISISSYKSESEEKTKSEKSEGELSTSSSELSDTDNKSKTELPQDEGKHHSDSSQKPSKPKSDHKSKSEAHGREREREKDKDSKHSKDKEKKHSKSRDDHHSHRDKDKKHHRRDKDHDGDRERSRSHHHQSSSSSGKDGSSSGKSSGEKDKERSSHHSGEKSSEGKSRRESAVDKEGKSIGQTDSKSEGSSSESSISSSKQDGTGDKTDGKLCSKSESRNEKTEVRSTSKSDKNKHGTKTESKTEKSDSKSTPKTESKASKMNAEKTEKKHDAHSSKHSSKHKKHEGERSHSDKEKYKSSSKDEKKKKDEKDGKKEKEAIENKHGKEDKEPKHEKEVKERKQDKEGKDQKRDAESAEESRQREDKDRRRNKEEREKSDKEDKGKKADKEEKHKMKDASTVVTEDDKQSGESKLKNIKSTDSDDKKTKLGKDFVDKKLKSHKESTARKSESQLKGVGIKDDALVLFDDDKNVMLVSFDDDDDDGDDEPLTKRKREKKVHKKSLRGFENAKKIKKNRLEKTQKKNAEKETALDFEGFSSVEKDTRLADFLSATQRVPDEMDMEYSEWFDGSDLRIVVSESDIKERMDFGEFLSCMHKLGAIIKESSTDMELGNESDSKEDNLPKTQSITEKKNDARLQGKRRRMSTSSSTSSSASSSGSPKHKRARTNRVTRSYASQLVEQDPVIVSGFALLTPEDDGNRTSSRDYEVDYSQRINTYSPLSPASDSSADDGKAKPSGPGSIDGRSAQADENGQKVKDPEIFKPANTWTNEEGNVSV